MPKNPEKAARAKEKKERKQRELQQKQSREKLDEAKLLMDPPEPKAHPNYNKAIAALDAAIALWPEHVDAYRLRGECYRELGNLDTAIENYSTAIGLNDKDGPSLEGRASCYVAQRKWDAAIADYSKMIEVNPSLDHPYNMRALARLHKRAPGLRLRNAELASVISDFTRAIHLNPNNYHAMCNLASCLEEHSMHLEAVEQYTAALKVKDDYLYASYRRGLAILALVEEKRREAELGEQKKREAEAEAKLAEVRRREALARDGKLESKSEAPVVYKTPAAAPLPSPPSEEEAIRILEAEREAEAAAAEQARLLAIAVADFSRVIPAAAEDQVQAELPSVLHRATCYMHLGQLDKAAADLKIVAAVLDSIKGGTSDTMAESRFGGLPYAVLKDILALRRATYAALQNKERRVTSHGPAASLPAAAAAVT